MLFILSLGDFEWRTDMTEVVLDVKLASLGVLNISSRGLTDYTLSHWCFKLDDMDASSGTRIFSIKQSRHSLIKLVVAKMFEVVMVHDFDFRALQVPTWLVLIKAR